MPVRVDVSHTIDVPLPLDRCFRLFTPAGEEIWVAGWQPSYVYPTNGHTEAGMVFTTQAGNDFTIWTLVDFDPDAHYSRYARTTPALRTGTVEVRCIEIDRDTTSVTVTYCLTALSPAGELSLAAFEAATFRRMIDGWRDAILARLPQLRTASIR